MEDAILLIEDEKNLLSVIKLNLEMDGYTVTAFDNGEMAWQKFRGSQYALIILDVMLPGMDGFELCRNIRKVDKHTPILFLTARGDAEDRIKGLKLGADDYLPKPFHLEELLLRVKGLLKRSSHTETLHGDDMISFGGNKINFLSYEIFTTDGMKHQVSKREIELLRLLIEHKNEVVPRDTILEKVWGYETAPSTRTVDNYIVSFRKYFEEDPKNPKHFHSIRGVGYKFTE
ncbi:MAG TPA: response regulator transcription factor [Bacteroidia bacterium]|jgi:two-component system alkaline phosphatase synthesis response regulator PhoP|nr:response regulator transcription factor [Bacteroidia bacterium]